MALIRHCFPGEKVDDLTDERLAQLYTEALFIDELQSKSLENAMLNALVRVFGKKT
ncbi:hypothetical protein [Nodularia spumigena]|uniref:hypothetical protein n=1 Tax=Nodularia spumigena TaxID=70799 RepID=UPI00232C6F66|nr:hypothetical protein [Nodularia spumigena]MDB9498573.1 hypothetical protein [Nodularia spumigena CS-336/02]